jgi:hypothetical protein
MTSREIAQEVAKCERTRESLIALGALQHQLIKQEIKIDRERDQEVCDLRTIDEDLVSGAIERAWNDADTQPTFAATLGAMLSDPRIQDLGLAAVAQICGAVEAAGLLALIDETINLAEKSGLGASSVKTLRAKR